jgi:hypothetical protein
MRRVWETLFWGHTKQKNRIDRLQTSLERTRKDSEELKIPAKRKEQFGINSEIMEGFWFAIFTVGLNRHNPGNYRDDNK